MHESSAPSAESNASAHKALVRFYVYQQEVSEQKRLDLVCLLVEKAQTAHQRVAILCADNNQATLLDEQLWSFKPQSFIPHCYSEDDLANKATAVLCIAPQRLENADVAINLSLEHHIDIPKASGRVFEIVNQTPQVLTATRARFKRYKQIGLSPKTFNI